MARRTRRLDDWTETEMLMLLLLLLMAMAMTSTAVFSTTCCMLLLGTA